MKLALLLIIATVNMWGQKQAPIWQTVFTNKTTTGVSTNVKNIGQGYHQVYAVASNNGGVCNPNQIGFTLEGSYDNITWLAFTPVVSFLTSPVMIMTGVGSYPFIRVNLISQGVNCNVNAWYTGSLDSSPNNVYQLGQSLGYIGINVNSSAGTIPITDRGSLTTKKTPIYYWQFSIGASANPVTVSLRESINNLCNPAGTLYYQVTFPASTTTLRTLTLGNNNVPLFINPTLGEVFCAHWTPGETLQSFTLSRLE